MKSAYGRRLPSEDPELTHVGPGTPMGELMRRYWQPVGVSDQLQDLPKRVRILGEDLVLFRDKQGSVGLLDLHCAHRGASLEWARVEDDGLRCCYHGWLYDCHGLCIDMPLEDDAYAQRRRVEQPAYPVHEFGGLVFAYMGPPDKQPDFPRYDVYDVSAGQAVLRGMKIWGDASITQVRDCNWLQHFENVMDPLHIPVLHIKISGPQFSGALEALRHKPYFEFEETSIGMRHHVMQRLPNGSVLDRYVEVAVPNVLLLPSIFEKGQQQLDRDKPSEVTWMVPEDDTHVTAFSIVVWPLKEGQPDPDFRPRTDTVAYDDKGNEIRPGAYAQRPDEDRQRRPDDKEAQEGQRPIAVHALENLVSSDRGVVQFRRLLRRQLAAIVEGRDPLGIVRDLPPTEYVETHAWNTVMVPGKEDEQ